MQPHDRRDAVLRLALPAPDLDLTVDPGTVVLTPHAVQRYRERVEGVPRRLAVRRLQTLIATAQWWSRPRAWTEVVLHPDVIYGYSPDRPDVCLLLRRQVLVTVLSRRFLLQAGVRQPVGFSG
jgi:hypothetical protein